MESPSLIHSDILCPYRNLFRHPTGCACARQGVVAAAPTKLNEAAKTIAGVTPSKLHGFPTDFISCWPGLAKGGRFIVILQMPISHMVVPPSCNRPAQPEDGVNPRPLSTLLLRVLLRPPSPTLHSEGWQQQLSE